MNSATATETDWLYTLTTGFVARAKPGSPAAAFATRYDGLRIAYDARFGHGSASRLCDEDIARPGSMRGRGDHPSNFIALRKALAEARSTAPTTPPASKPTSSATVPVASAGVHSRIPSNPPSRSSHSSPAGLHGLACVKASFRQQIAAARAAGPGAEPNSVARKSTSTSSQHKPAPQAAGSSGELFGLAKVRDSFKRQLAANRQSQKPKANPDGELFGLEKVRASFSKQLAAIRARRN